MNKKQKIWLAVSLAMFLVPEILWGLTQYALNQITDDLLNIGFDRVFCILNNLSYLDIRIIRLLLICQFLGTLGLFVVLLKYKKINLLKFFSLFFLFLIILIIIFSFLMTFLFTLSGIG